MSKKSHRELTIEQAATEFIDKYMFIFAHNNEAALRTGFIQSLLGHYYDQVNEAVERKYDKKFRNDIEKELQEKWEFNKGEVEKEIKYNLLRDIKRVFEEDY